MASSDSSLRFRYREVSRVPLLNFPNTRSSYAPRGRLRVASRSPSATCPPLRSGAFRFDHPSRFDGLLLASWCLNTGHAEISIITRLYEGDSLALSLIRSSGETRTHRSPFARPTILTVRRLLYSNGFLPPFSSAELCSAYQSLPNPQLLHHSYSTIGVRPSPPPKKSTHSPINSPSLSFQLLIFFCCFSISSYVR